MFLYYFFTQTRIIECMKRIWLFPITFILACGHDKSSQPQFKEIHDRAQVHFVNQLTYTELLNPYTFRNFYNGGGVALGDINNDGLTDIYFTGNQVDNKLFLNKGNLIFEDISDKAGVSCPNVWSTGATFVDVNADGLLDLYVCKSGPPGGANRHNELFINNGDLTFTESSKKYGLDISGLSVQSAFFDHDKDGDLDCYLLTNSIRSVGNYDLVEGARNIPDPGGNRFLINEGGRYVDASQEVGIYTSNIGFGLGITLEDYNYDGWVDLYISNDFFERDYLYINNQKGGFTEDLEGYFNSISMGSMGADVADLNNDGLLDLIVTEMLPDSLNRVKSKAIFENWDKYQLNVTKGYHHQFPRNTLQRGIGSKQYLEVGRFANVAATEWSWSALIFDMDNDGLKDIFVSNGIYKDLLDRDYLNFTATDQRIRQMIQAKEDIITRLVDQMPSQAVPNYLFKNAGSLYFVNIADSLGLGAPTFSNGSVYGDLDNDGDLDLVVNNVNQPAHIYENQLDTASHRSIKIKASTDGDNRFAIGLEVKVFVDGATLQASNYMARGFQSSMEPIIHLGVGEAQTIDSVLVRWPDGSCHKMFDVPTNQIIVLEKENIENVPCWYKNADHYDFQILKKSDRQFQTRHIENRFVDFNRERLLLEMCSNEGPRLGIADINRDGADEIFMGGAKGHPGQILSLNNTFNRNTGWMQDYADSEDVDNVFFDADGDGDQDLYVATGGRAFAKSSSALQDHLLLNDGTGNFSKGEKLPFQSFFSSSTVINSDFDKDGDEDLFVGERFHPFFYGISGRGYLLRNNGKGVFDDVSELLPGINGIGMITDAKWGDINNDQLPDLVVVGEWMGVTLFLNTGDRFENQSKRWGLGKTSGLWHTVEIGDFDGNGFVDIAAGNHGLNTFMKPDNRFYYSDFDQNGAVDQIFCQKVGDKYYPIHDRDELIAQIPTLKKRILYYQDYSEMDIDAIFGAEVISQAAYKEVACLESSLFMNDGGRLNRTALPAEIQYAPVYAIYTEDINNDSRSDFLIGGNQYNVKPQFGRYDASSGWLLMSGHDGEYQAPVALGVAGQVRDIKKANTPDKEYYIFARNNDFPVVYEKVH